MLRLLTNAAKGLLTFLIVMVVTCIGTVLGSTIACTYCVCAIIVLRFLHLPWEFMRLIVALPAIPMIFIPTMMPVFFYCKVGWPQIPVISSFISGINSMRLSTSLAVLGGALGILLVMLGALYGSLPEIIKYINQLIVS